MMKPLRYRITWSFLVLIGLSIIGTGAFVALLLKTSYLESMGDRYIKEGKLIIETLDFDADIQTQLENQSRILESDLILFDQQGNWMAGTTAKEEIAPINLAILEEGVENHSQQLVTTIPIKRGDQRMGALQLIQDKGRLNGSLQPVWFSLALGMAVAYALVALASARIARSVTKPIEEMTQVAVDIAKNRIQKRVQQEGDDEVARLGQAINRMAHSLRKQMDTIRKSERRLSSVIESMESGLLMIDPMGKVSVANASFERLLGVPISDIIGKPHTELTYPYNLSKLITESAESGERLKKEVHLYYPKERMLELNFAPMWVEKNGVGVVVVIHDLTAIRRLEQLRKDFVANVSHELKTPITSIRGFAETLLDGAMQDDETCKEFLTIIYDESLRLQRLIADILDLSRIESRQLALQTEAILIKNVIEKIVIKVEKQRRMNGQQLEIDVPHNMTVSVDLDRFHQIILNLLTNAMAYTPNGGTIGLKVMEQKHNWTLQVTDNGIGIPEDDLPRIFERFYRVEKDRSRASGGTGLGLAIVKHLVEAHHGTIHVHSRVGKGTTFILDFPK
ncbi:HAMP domain-containing protein [Hazenella sp. IB182357]|uniref:histidine kinase n=1 Tax=Polycladospora coralii TaxID=2771432 RepID=A0A926NAC7_9BACL|nr:HAMP domain-containing sensor histidine kinase [Polycladospora coralii]MBD1372788.1 HAMP domain-containing protein [Polycladospora coralii]MBS7529514.1 HAMP domain-containing protein [Polycladospora coralii]